MLSVKLEYRPCTCPSHVQAAIKGSILVPDDAAEHFEQDKIAAIRFRQLVVEGKTPRVHHLGTHVSAAILNGKRFTEG